MNGKQLAKQMLKSNPEYLDDARRFAPIGNSVVGSLLSIVHHIPRQYAEQYVMQAAAELSETAD